MDGGGFIVDWNPEAEDTFGWRRGEAIGRVLADTIVPERLRESHWKGLQTFLETGEGPVLGRRLELPALHRDGREFPVEITISAVRHGDRHLFHAFLHDISDRKRAEQYVAVYHAVTEALAEAESTAGAVPSLLEALGRSLDCQFGAYWTPHEEGGLRCVTTWREPDSGLESFEELTKTTVLGPGAGIPGQVWQSAEPAWIEDVLEYAGFQRAGEAEASGLRAAICLPVMSGAQVRGVVEFFTGHARHPEAELLELLGGLTRQIGRFFSVLDDRGEALSKLESLALTDELTGLANRRAWDEGLERELARARRHSHRLCVAMLDLDHFKDFNDEHGHPAGDDLLREAAQAWQPLVRVTDLLARYGGEEFALAFPSWPMEPALTVVERLRAAMPRDQTCSAGLVVWDGEESGDELVARADAALYEAKRGGRDRTVTQ
jgi:diguanylate cyclase (GGDEF)-like protein/PAS domain S-box-containing protein